jgi:hypothetical protein
MQDGCVRAKKDRVRLRVRWRTAASEHGRSYAITLHPTTNVSATQGVPRNWLLWFVWFVSFNWLNQTNRIDQINRTDQSNRSARYHRRTRPCGAVMPITSFCGVLEEGGWECPGTLCTYVRIDWNNSEK